MKDEDNPVTPRLLEGLLVAEVGARVAVGACGSLLAQLGATVVTIEPDTKDRSGKWINRAAMMAGKHSIVIDPRAAEDASLYARLLQHADVVLLSSDFEASEAERHASTFGPHQIVLDITAFGGEGPRVGQGGDEIDLQAFCGVLDTTGPGDGSPVPVGAPILEMTAGVYGAASVLLARRARHHHPGQRIDIAIADVGISFLANFLALVFAGRPSTRSGNRHPLYVPWGCYSARDGQLLICSVTNDQFARIAAAIGKPEIVADERFASPTQRLLNVRLLDDAIGAWAAERSLDACETAMREAGIPCGRVATLDDLAREPNLLHRHSQRWLDDPDTGQPARVVVSPLLDPAARDRVDLRIPARGSSREAVAALLRQQSASAASPVGRPGFTGEHSELDERLRDFGRNRYSLRETPLQGIRIVEIGQYTVAPFAARLLGSFGADVIKIEPPRGDAVRYGPPLRPDGMSYIFALSNTDKRGLVLDLAQPADRDALDRLLAQSDLLIENLRPGALERLGFGPDALRRKHPKLIYCAVTGFGRESVYGQRPALDSVIQAMSGLMSQTRVDGAPMKAGISAADSIGGLFGMLAMLVGLEHRDRYGASLHFDLSMQDSAAWVTQMPLVAADAPQPRVIPASDGFVATRAHNALQDTSWSKALSRTEVVDRLAQLGIRATPIKRVAEVVADEHTRARRLLVECACRDASSWTVLNTPMRLSETPPHVRTTLGPLGTGHAELMAELGLVAASETEGRQSA